MPRTLFAKQMRAIAEPVVDANILASAARGLSRLTPLQAAAAAQGNQTLLAAFSRLRAQSARYGIELGDSLLDIHEVDQKLRAANVPLESRFQYKASLAFLKLV